MKKLFRKLFRIKYTYFIVVEFMQEDRPFRSSCTATTDYPVGCKEYDRFTKIVESEMRKRHSDSYLHKFIITSISRL